jgi:hypothetical protein
VGQSGDYVFNPAAGCYIDGEDFDEVVVAKILRWWSYLFFCCFRGL